jgi:hypothetical protein
MNGWKSINDETIMPWGKHKGEKLANIPAGYFLWLEVQIKQKPNLLQSVFEQKLLRYIQDNMDILILEIERENG